MGAWSECTICVCVWGGLARVYHLCMGEGPGTSVPLVCVWGGWHECTTCVCGGGLARAYHWCVWGGGVARSHHCLTATVAGGQFRLCRFHDVLAQVLGSPCTKCVCGGGGLARVYDLCVWGGLARVYDLCVCGGAGTSVPLVSVGGGLARVYHLCVGGGWHECTTCVCGGGGSHVHTTASLLQWTGGQFRFCRFQDVLAQVPPVPWLPL